MDRNKYLVKRGGSILMVDSPEEGDEQILGPTTHWNCWDKALRSYGVDVGKPR